MIWLCFYIIYFAAIVLFVKTRLKLPVKLAVLAACLIVQLADISPLIKARHERYPVKREYTNPFAESPAMASLLNEGGFSHISIASSMESEELFAVAQFAMQNGMTVNRFWTVHQIGRDDEEEILLQDLASPQEGTLFLFKKEDEGLCRDYGLDMTDINGKYTIGVPKPARKQR